MTPSQEIMLAKRARNSDPVAIEKLVLHNIRLAINIAKKWQNRGVPLEDLVQEGILGLDRAARKFDPTRELRFSTYATHWVNQFIQRAVHNKGATIRVPSHITVRRIAIEEHLTDHPNATYPELASAASCKEGEVLEALASSRVVTSLDIESDETHSVYAKLSDPQALDPDELLFTDSRVRDAMLLLDATTRRVVELRFGIDGPERSRKEVAQIMELKESEVQKMLKSAMVILADELADLRPKETDAEG